jgi:choline kinase
MLMPDRLVAATKRMKISCPVADGLIWAEIDDESHLRRAREEIYPLLSAGTNLTINPHGGPEQEI